MKVSPNFEKALDALINGWSFYHSNSDVLIAPVDGERELRYPNIALVDTMFRLTLSPDKHSLTIWCNNSKWGAKNRRERAIERFGVLTYKHYLNGGISPEGLNYATYQTTGSWIDSAKEGVAAASKLNKNVTANVVLNASKQKEEVELVLPKTKIDWLAFFSNLPFGSIFAHPGKNGIPTDVYKKTEDGTWTNGSSILSEINLAGHYSGIPITENGFWTIEDIKSLVGSVALPADQKPPEHPKSNHTAVSVKFVTTSADDIVGKQQQSPSSAKSDNRSFEELWGLRNRDKNILTKTSEFYLLSVAALKNKEKHETRYKEYAREFAELLKNYLAMACGGELRHTRHSNVWIESFRNSDKIETWRAWYSIYSANPLSAAKKATEEFLRKGAWGGAFGGKPWGKASEYLVEFIEGKYTPAMFVDLVIDLEHNTGCIFNKWFDNTQYLKTLLDAKFRGKDEDYEVLLKSAITPEIKVAYVGDAVESVKYQRLLARRFGIEKLVVFRPYRQCERCKRELAAGEKICKTCITCPQCKEIISLPLGPLLPEFTYHTCQPVKIILPSVEYVK